jgi:2-polyprenyl-3-methyl-5-hydroxy-6-metoxy-1,4-benzoquinol methylase
MEKEYREKYAELYRRHWWWRARERALLHAIDRLFTSRNDLRILDIGCGDGLFFDALSRFGKVEGIENDASLISANNPHRANIHAIDLATFKPPEKYDLVLLLDVLEHLDDSAAFLRLAMGLLKDEGRVIVTVPAFQGIWTRHDDLNHHRQRFTRKTFEPVAEQGGMTSLTERYLFQWSFAAKVLVRMLEKLQKAVPAPPSIPPQPVNGFLCAATALEETIGRALPLPFGSSLMVIGKKAAEVQG